MSRPSRSITSCCSSSRILLSFLDLATGLTKEDKMTRRMRNNHRIRIKGKEGNEMKVHLDCPCFTKQHTPSSILLFLFLLLLSLILLATSFFTRSRLKVTRFLYSKKKREEKKSWCHRPFPDDHTISLHHRVQYKYYSNKTFNEKKDW